MRKIFFVLVAIFVPATLSADLFYDYGINLGFQTLRLIGDNSSTKTMYKHNGGGLIHAEPGVDFGATFFIDTNYKHRLIIGGEYDYMLVKEVEMESYEQYDFMHHKVQLFNVFLGYHYSFYQARWQSVRFYSGAEILYNNMLANELLSGKQMQQSASPMSENRFSKDLATRIGARLKIGFEGRLYKNFFINSNFTIGYYNLLLRDDATGELFNKPASSPELSFDSKESLQLYYNINVGFQLRFNSLHEMRNLQREAEKLINSEI